MVGESESSESVDNDHDEHFETIDDHWSPVVTARATELPLERRPLSPTLPGKTDDIRRASFGDDEYGFGISEGTKDDPPSLGASMEERSGNVVRKKLVRYTKSDEGLSGETEKVRSRPTSLILDEDMSYVSAPRFDIPSKRRQHSISEDLTLKPEASSEEADNESHLSMYEEQVESNKGNLDHQLSIDVTIESENLRSETEEKDLDYVLDKAFEIEKENFRADNGNLKGQNTSVVSEDSAPKSDTRSGSECEHMAEVFGFGKENFASYSNDVGSDLPKKIHDDEHTKLDLKQPASKVELEIAEVFQDDVEFDVGLHEVFQRKEREDDTESSSEINRKESIHLYADRVSPKVEFGIDNKSDNRSLTNQGNSGSLKRNTEEFDMKSGDFSGENTDFSTTNEVRGDLNTVSRSKNDGTFKRFAVEIPTRDIPMDFDRDGDDNENTEILSVLSRIKNWETKSKEDRFEKSPEKTVKTLDISIDKDGKMSPRKRYEISLESGGNEATSVSTKENTDVTKQSKDLSGINDAYAGHLRIDDVGMKHGNPPEEVELLEELPENNDISICDISLSEATQSDFSTEHNVVEAAVNLERIGMGLQVEKSLENSDIGISQVSPDPTGTFEFPSEDISVGTESLNLEKNAVALGDVASEISGTSVGNLGPSEPIQNDSEKEPITVKTSLDLEKGGMELHQESCDENEISTGDWISGVKAELPCEDVASMGPEYQNFSDDTQFKTEEDLDVPLAGNAIRREPNEEGIFHELSSETKSNVDINSSNIHSSFMSSGNFTASSPLKSDTFVDNEATQFSANNDIGLNPFESEEDDVEEAGIEGEAFGDVEVRPEISATNQSNRSEQRDLVENVVHPASDEAPPSAESRMDAMQAFSETFASVDVSMKRGVSHEDEIDDPDKTLSYDISAGEETLEYPGNLEEEERGHHTGSPREDRGYLVDQDASEHRDQYHANRDTLEDRGHDADDKEREYLAGHGAGGEAEFREDPERELTHEYSIDKEHAGARVDRGAHEGSEGPDSRRSSDLQYEGFRGDNESAISDTSGYYGTPYASEDTASKRTTSISGDEGTSADDARGPLSVSTAFLFRNGRP